jgi:hypothetical protein
MFPTGAPTQRWKEVITTINNEANRTRLKIPVLYGIDAYRRCNIIPSKEWQLLLILK